MVGGVRVVEQGNTPVPHPRHVLVADLQGLRVRMRVHIHEQDMTRAGGPLQGPVTQAVSLVELPVVQLMPVLGDIRAGYVNRPQGSAAVGFESGQESGRAVTGPDA